MGSKLTIVSLLCLPTHICVYFLVFKSWLRPWAFFYISIIIQTAVSRELHKIRIRLIWFVNYKKGCTRLAAANDKVYQLLAHGRWFSPGTPASSTTKTGRHDIAEILLKAVFKHNKSNQINLILILCNSRDTAVCIIVDI
jgi:hypothetical protein